MWVTSLTEKSVSYGLVSRVVPDDELLERSVALAEQIASFFLPALMAIKAAVNRAWESSLTEGILFERHALYERFASADAHEGMHALLGKRRTCACRGRSSRPR